MGGGGGGVGIASNSNCDLESPLGFLVEKKEKLIWITLVWKKRLFLDMEEKTISY